jgi:hypothetical protein
VSRMYSISLAFTIPCYSVFTSTFVSGKELRFQVLELPSYNALLSKFRALMSRVAQKTLLCVPTQVRRVCSHSKTFLAYSRSWCNVASHERGLFERGSCHAFLFFWARHPIKLNTICPVFQWTCHTRLHVSCTTRSRDTFGSSTD